MMNTTITGNGAKSVPTTEQYIIFQPFNLVTFLSTFSPIILIISLLAYSFFYQNVKGFVYLGFLLAAVILRSVFLQAIGSNKNADNCLPVRYADYGNATFSLFVFAFTTAYLFLPMYMVGAPNWFLFIFIIAYTIFDLGIKQLQGCISLSKQLSSLIGDYMGGLLISLTIIMAMYGGGSEKYLFFADQTQNGTICSMPSKQTMRCSVYKNGKLLSSTNA